MEEAIEGYREYLDRKIEEKGRELNEQVERTARVIPTYSINPDTGDYVKRIFQLAWSDQAKGIKVNGEATNNIIYADDTAILADTNKDLQDTLFKVSRVGKLFGLKINSTKTKFMVIIRHQDNQSQIII